MGVSTEWHVLPNFLAPLLSEEGKKQRTSIFVRYSQGQLEKNAMKIFGKSGHWRSQGVPKIFWVLRGYICDSTAFLFTLIIAMDLDVKVRKI